MCPQYRPHLLDQLQQNLRIHLKGSRLVVLHHPDMLHHPDKNAMGKLTCKTSPNNQE